MKTIIIWLAAFFTASSLQLMPLLAAEMELSTKLKSTIDRYLLASPNYRDGDLLTRSRMEELQDYLRRTKGNSLVTHSRWRQKMLPDRAPLAKLFFSGGSKVLRAASDQLGSYAELDLLSRSKSGRKRLEDAIRANEPKELARFLLANREKSVAGATNESEKHPSVPATARIYTIADLLAGLAASKTDANPTEKGGTLTDEKLLQETQKIDQNS